MARLILSSLVLWLCLAHEASLAAAEFRIENRVFLDEEPEPVSESVTFFQGGRVFDFFGDENGEIAVFDPANERFILLDPARRIKTEVKTSYLDSYVEVLKKKATGHENEFVRFLAEPKFERSYDQDAARLTMKSPTMTYHVDTIPAASEEAARVYGQFSDAYARLSAVTSDVPLPPFPRLAVNAVLRERKELPKRVERTVERTGLGPLPDKSVTIHSEHKIAWRLLDSDKQRISTAGKYLAAFDDVPLQVYRSAPPATTAQK
jgi:hypothetical protein